MFNRGSHTVNLSKKEKHKVTGLIGEKCLIKVLLNNKLSSVLLDTGAQVSVISDKYLRQNFLHVDGYPVNELLNQPDYLRVYWRNQRERDDDDDDVVENTTYPMEINLKDSNPMQLNYNSVPRNLYNELKMWTKDLLNKK